MPTLVKPGNQFCDSGAGDVKVFICEELVYLKYIKNGFCPGTIKIKAKLSSRFRIGTRFESPSQKATTALVLQPMRV